MGGGMGLKYLMASMTLFLEVDLPSASVAHLLPYRSLESTYLWFQNHYWN